MEEEIESTPFKEIVDEILDEDLEVEHCEEVIEDSGAADELENDDADDGAEEDAPAGANELENEDADDRAEEDAPAGANELENEDDVDAEVDEDDGDDSTPSRGEFRKHLQEACEEFQVSGLKFR